MLGLTTAEVMDLTPAEFEWRLEGVQAREKAQWRRTAWLISHVLSAWVKDPPSVDKLLGQVVIEKRPGKPVERHRAE